MLLVLSVQILSLFQLDKIQNSNVFVHHHAFLFQAQSNLLQLSVFLILYNQYNRPYYLGMWQLQEILNFVAQNDHIDIYVVHEMKILSQQKVCY
jgi:hypothetical protein